MPGAAVSTQDGVMRVSSSEGRAKPIKRKGMHTTPCSDGAFLWKAECSSDKALP